MFSMPKIDLGTVTGIVGAISGLSGCILGWIGYRRSRQTEMRVPRLELRKQVTGVRIEIDALPALLERARLSRSAVSAAMGRGQQSSSIVTWKRQLESDLKTVQALASELPGESETHQRSSPQELENKLVAVHTLAAKVAMLRDKYEAALAADDNDRDHIRASAHRRNGLQGQSSYRHLQTPD